MNNNKDLVSVSLIENNNGITISCDTQLSSNSYVLTLEQVKELIVLNNKLTSEVIETRKEMKRVISKYSKGYSTLDDQESKDIQNNKIDPAIRKFLIKHSEARITLYKKILEIIPNSEPIKASIQNEEKEIKEINKTPKGKLFKN